MRIERGKDERGKRRLKQRRQKVEEGRGGKWTKRTKLTGRTWDSEASKIENRERRSISL